MEIDDIVRGMETGLPKLWVAHTALRLRGLHAEWLGADADYTPLVADGPKREHLVGFVRAGRVATIVPRWTLKLGDSWAGTTVELPAGNWKNLLARETVRGGRQRVQPLLQRFPVGLLVREEA